MDDTILLDQVLFDLEAFEATAVPQNADDSDIAETKRKALEDFFGRTNSIE